MSAPRAVIYTRISRDVDGDGAGVERQEIDARALARKRGYDVVEVVEENDTSASDISGKERPKYLAMLDGVRAGRYDVVLAYSRSRLIRDLDDFVDLKVLWRQTGLRVETVVSGDVDLSTADGEMLATIQTAVDVAEARRVQERIHRANRHRVEVLGEPTNGIRYGWRRGLGGAMELDPDAAAVVAEIAHRITRGESLNSIKKDLNTRAVPTPRMVEIARRAEGGGVGDQRSRGIPSEVVAEIAERTVAGESLTGIVADLRDRRARFPQWTHGTLSSVVRRPANVARIVYQGQTYPGKFPPILDEDTFERVDLILGDPERRPRRPAGMRNREIRNFLTGVAVCGKVMPDGTECRGRTRVATQSKSDRKYPDRTLHRSYSCTVCFGSSCRTYQAEAAVQEVVLAYLEDPRTPALLSGDPDEVAAQEARISGLTERRRRLARAYADGAYEDDEYADLLCDVDADLADARQRLVDAGPRPELTRWLDGNEPEATWEAATPGERRDLVAALMTVVILPGGRGRKEFDPDRRLRIEWRVPVARNNGAVSPGQGM